MSFSCLSVLAKTHSTMLNRNGWIVQTSLFGYWFSGVSVQSVITEYEDSCEFFVDILYQVTISCFLFLVFWRFFFFKSWKGIGFFFSYIFCAYWDNCSFCSLIYYMLYYYYLEWILNVKPILHSWAKFHLARVYNLFYILCIQFASILFRIFAYIFIKEILCSFYFLFCLCLVLLSGYYWPHERKWEVFSPLLNFVRYCEGLVLILKMVVESISEIISPSISLYEI